MHQQATFAERTCAVCVTIRSCCAFCALCCLRLLCVRECTCCIVVVGRRSAPRGFCSCSGSSAASCACSRGCACVCPGVLVCARVRSCACGVWPQNKKPCCMRRVGLHCLFCATHRTRRHAIWHLHAEYSGDESHGFAPFQSGLHGSCVCLMYSINVCSLPPQSHVSTLMRLFALQQAESVRVFEGQTSHASETLMMLRVRSSSFVSFSFSVASLLSCCCGADISLSLLFAVAAAVSALAQAVLLIRATRPKENLLVQKRQSLTCSY